MRNHKSRWKARRTWRDLERRLRPIFILAGYLPTVKQTRDEATKALVWRIERCPESYTGNLRPLAAL